MPASWRAKMSRSREKAEARGHVAEFVALMYLRLKGYRLLAQRFKSPQGEVDLHEIVGCRAIAEHRPRIAAQAGNLGEDRAAIHGLA